MSSSSPPLHAVATPWKRRRGGGARGGRDEGGGSTRNADGDGGGAAEISAEIAAEIVAEIPDCAAEKGPGVLTPSLTLHLGPRRRRV